MVGLVLGLRGNRVDPDDAVLEGDLEAQHVVREQVEGTAALQVEARVVPVTGQDAVAHAAAVQREAHVRAAVVDRVDLALVREHGDAPARCAHDHHTAALDLVQGSDTDSFANRGSS